MNLIVIGTGAIAHKHSRLALRLEEDHLATMVVTLAVHVSARSGRPVLRPHPIKI